MSRPIFPNDRKNNKLNISKHAYLTKKFLGFVLAFDFDNIQFSSRKCLFSFEFKFLFFGCYLTIYDR